MPQVYKKYKKSNTWNIRLLVDDSFVPSSKQPSVIYCKLTDFYPQNKVQDVGFNEFIFFSSYRKQENKAWDFGPFYIGGYFRIYMY